MRTMRLNNAVCESEKQNNELKAAKGCTKLQSWLLLVGGFDTINSLDYMLISKRYHLTISHSNFSFLMKLQNLALQKGLIFHRI